MGESDAPSPPSPPSRDSHARLILVHRNKSRPSTHFSRDDRCDPGLLSCGDAWRVYAMRETQFELGPRGRCLCDCIVRSWPCQLLSSSP